MKKFTFLIFCFMVGIMTAFANDNYYIPERNTYYQRSQHTYSFKKSNGEYHNEYVVSLYTLIKNLEEAKDTSIWTFEDKYEVPWTTNNNSYAIAYCANLDVNIAEEVPYNQVKIKDSHYISDNIKKNLIGIIKNSYPFISYEKMKENLTKAGILTIVNIGDKEILTSKKNADIISNYESLEDFEIKDITMDELISGVQMAIYYYTNANQIEEDYFNTLTLSSRSILKSKGLWSNVYSNGEYDWIKNNILDVRDYLISQEGKILDDLSINTVFANKTISGYKLSVNFNREIEENSMLKIEIYENDNLLNEEIIDLDENNTMELNINKNLDIKKIKLKINGNEYLNNNVVIYEASNSKESSQTLIGMIDDFSYIESYFDGEIKIIDEVDNPNTGNAILYTFAGVLSLLGMFVYIKVYKKRKIFKI